MERLTIGGSVIDAKGERRINEACKARPHKMA